MSNWKKTIAAGALLLTAAAPALADNNDWRERWSGWGMGRMMGGWGTGGPMMGYGGDYTLDRIDGRLAFIETELRITEEQAPAWDELASVFRATAETHNDAMEEMMEAFHDGDFWTRSLPDRLAFQQAHMETRLAEMKAVSQAVDTFYVVLSAKQKKAADDIILPTMGMGMMMGGYGPGMMMGPWGGGGPGMMMR